MCAVRLLKNDSARLCVELQKLVRSHPWSEESFVTLLENPNSLCLFLEHNETAIGFILCFLTPPEGEILEFVIAPEHQNQGYGKLLLAALESKAILSGVEEIFLEVSTNNLKAINLYTKSSYLQYGRRPGYYADGGDALTLKKTLNQTRYH